MAIDLDDEILQDFLVEAGELLEQLNEQLVELERSPEDKDLLNAVFRAFHTVKGGAGFVNLTAMVELCHRAEDVFNRLRSGELTINAELMDAVLKALDALNRMFDQVRGGSEPEPADRGLIAQLEAFANGQAPAPEAASADAGGARTAAASSGEDITDAEFDALVAAMDAPKSAEAQGEAEPSGGGDITDEEFEALLDQLHGKGRHGGRPVATSGPDAGGGDDTITEEEFEALLDQLHGKGKAPGASRRADEAEKKASPGSGPASAQTEAAAAPKPAAVKPAAASKPGEAPPAEATVRVDTRRLDELMNLVGELVLVRNRIATLQAAAGAGVNDSEMSKSVANLDQVTSDIQAAVMKTRMQPIKKVFGRFPRVVRDLARSLEKEVELELVGEDTDLDKNLVEALADPLVHLVRNAVDHGIEPPQERVAAGKARAGRVVLSARQAGDHILITIEDDGRGMDADVLRAKAVEKGVLSQEQAARLSEQEVFNLIFAPGFSTKSQISDVSGRGVGMDVVKTRIGQLNGQVEIASQKGQGTVISIKLPLTLAILPTLMVVVGGRRFALPLANVLETYDLDLSQTNVVDDQEVLVVRGKPLPLFYLRRWLAPEADSARAEGLNHVVAVQFGNQRVCFVVDELLGQEEVVIKPLGRFLHGLPGFAGATITGDGRIALILDVPGLLRAYARRMAA